jgi:TPR repeat protein
VKYFNSKGDSNELMHFLNLNMKQKAIFGRIFGITPGGVRPGSQKRVLKDGAKRNHATALRELGMGYADGKFGTAPKMNKAILNLEKAVSMGDWKAKVALARILTQEGQPWTNTDRALKLLKDAADSDPRAVLILVSYISHLEQQGKIPVMMPENLGWKARAGDRSAFEQLEQMNTGLSNAILGQMFAEGNAVFWKDINAAHRYYTKALEKGYKPAMALLADLAEKEGNVDERNEWLIQLAQTRRPAVRQAAKEVRGFHL